MRDSNFVEILMLSQSRLRDEIRKEHVPKSKLTVTQCRITMVSESEVAQDEDYNS